MNYDFETTAKAGSKAIIDIFTKMNKKTKKIIKIKLLDDYQYSYYDAVAKIGDKVYLVEHKNRNYDDAYLKVIYKGKFIIEEKKYNNLLKTLEQYINNIDGILYICSTKDGINYIFNIKKDMKLEEDILDMDIYSCNKGYGKTMKKIYYLNIDNALVI